ncbi:MAG: phage tail protein [Nitrosospira sp.]|nr:phage tail protein [Nitrosospira sp.]
MSRLPDPYGSFRFSIEVTGETTVGGFNEVSGLVFETEVQTLRVGGINNYEHQLPGPSKFPSRLVLKRGLGNITFLWTWYRSVSQGEIKRKNITIKLKDENGGDLMTWGFKDACPVKWTGPDLRASNSAVAFESLELVHRGYFAL